MKKERRVINTEFYQFENLNPKGKFVGDCVIRAIAKATGQSWEETIRDMTEFGIKKGYELNDKKCYPKYLESKGFIERKEPRNWDNTKMTVLQFCKFTKDKVIVANVGTLHVTAIINNKVIDTWNCTNQTMHKYWVKED